MFKPSLVLKTLFIGAALVAGGCEDDEGTTPRADAAVDQRLVDTAPDVSSDVSLDGAGAETSPADMRDGTTSDASDTGGDLPVEAASACDRCAADELCVLFHDGPCGSQKVCKKKTAACSAPACTAECNRDMCGFGTDAGGSSTCNAAPCQETALYPQAVHCYGP
jgi:hypothetical protein